MNRVGNFKKELRIYENSNLYLKYFKNLTFKMINNNKYFI